MIQQTLLRRNNSNNRVKEREYSIYARVTKRYTGHCSLASASRIQPRLLPELPREYIFPFDKHWLGQHEVLVVATPITFEKIVIR